MTAIFRGRRPGSPGLAQTPLRLLAVMAIVGIASAAGIRLTLDAGSVASVWLANGLLIGWLLSVPPRRWCSYLCAGFSAFLVSNLAMHDDIGVSLGLSLCNTLEVALVATLMRRRLGRRVDLTSGRALRCFLLLGVVVGPVVSALVASLLLAGLRGAAPSAVFLVWYPADALGIAITTPLVLAVAAEQRQGLRSAMGALRRCLSAMPLVATTLGVFWQRDYPLLFMVLPPLMYLVFQQGSAGAAAGVAIIAVISIPLTIRQLGPIALVPSAQLQEQILILQVFIATTGAMALFLAFVLAQRQRANARLQKAERDLRAVTDNLPALIAHIDTRERYQLVNAQSSQLMGRSSRQLIGRSLREVLGERAYGQIAAPVAAALSGTPASFEHTVDAGGGPRHYHSHYIPDRADDGSVCGFYAMSFDITARKESEIRLARSEKWLKTLTDNLPVLIAHIDRQERYQFANTYYRTLFGVEPAGFIGKSLRESLGDEVYLQIQPHVERVLAGDRVRFERHGTERALDVHLLVDYLPDVDADGAVQGFFVCVMDITARKNAELRQAASEARLRTITDGLPGLIAYLDRAGAMRFCNATFEQWFGVPPEELIGRGLDEALGGRLLEAQGHHVSRALQGEKTESEFEIECRGERRHLHASYLPHRDQDGKVLGVYSLATDITPFKKIQKQLIQLARYDNLTGLANRGEFNNRLNAALNRVERSGLVLGLLFLDVDHFKSINDRHGHPAGDKVLQEIAMRLLGSVRKVDTVARLAGDEFVILMEDLNAIDEAQFVARKIIASMSRPILLNKAERVVSLSIGIVTHSGAAVPATDLIAAADKALYGAKAAGRNTYLHGA